MTGAAHKAGVACPCGSAELRVIVPGDDGYSFGIIGIVRPPRPDRAFCSFACATRAGWPWLASEAPKSRRRAA